MKSSKRAQSKLAELRRAFEEADNNRDGALNLSELMQFGLRMFGKKCPMEVYKGMCEYCSKTVEQGLDWGDIKKLFLESNDVTLNSAKRRRDPSRVDRNNESGGASLDFSIAQGGGHSRTQSLSSTFSTTPSLISTSTFRMESVSSGTFHNPNSTAPLGYIDEDRSSTSSSFERFQYEGAAVLTRFQRERNGGAKRHHVSKSLNNVADFYDDAYSPNQIRDGELQKQRVDIQNELVRILQHKLNKAQSKLTDLDKKKHTFEMKRLKETEERRAAEQTLRKLEQDMHNFQELNLIRRSSDEEARDVSADDIEDVYKKLKEFQSNHESIHVELLAKQEQIPKLKKEI